MTSSRLHIAHFTNTYFPVMSGVVRSVSSFRQAQEALGHLVFIFGQDAQDYQDKEPFVFRYPALNIPIRKYPVTIPVSPYIDWVLPILKLNVIHAHHPAPMGSAARDKAEKLGIPLVFTHHTRYQEYAQSMGISEDLVKDVVERMLADYMQRCQHIIAPSESIKRMIRETYGITERVTVVPTGIDLKPYETADGSAIRRERGWKDDEFVVISVGRLAVEKNFDTLVEALTQVMQRRPEVRLALIGDGPDRKTLQKQCQEAGVAERVDFVGQVPFDDVPRYLKAADAFAFASITETQGLVTLEAMATELPVAAVDATGTSDIVEDGVDGLLSADDAGALAEQVERIAADPELRAKLREGAKAKAAHYEMKNVASKMIDVYRQAVADKRAGVHVRVDERKPIFRVAWEKLFAV